MESNETSIFVVTRPSSPIIEDLKSIRMGLNISWKSDVNSKQEQYEVLYSRNGTSEVRTLITKESRLVIKNLQPGAGYELKVFAVSHELRSEPHAYFQAVCKLIIERRSSEPRLIRECVPSFLLQFLIRLET